jgi:hypothetical protein
MGTTLAAMVIANDHGKGGTSGIAVGIKIDVASIDGDGGLSNASQEEPTKEGFNQGLHIEDNPPFFDRNVNTQVPNVVILAVNNIDEDGNVPLSKMHTTIVQKRVPSIGRTFVGLDRLSPPTL